MGWAATLWNVFHALSSPVQAADCIVSANDAGPNVIPMLCLGTPFQREFSQKRVRRSDGQRIDAVNPLLRKTLKDDPE